MPMIKIKNDKKIFTKLNIILIAKKKKKKNTKNKLKDF